MAFQKAHPHVTALYRLRKTAGLVGRVHRFAVAGFILGAAATAVRAEPVADFYKGKTINFIIGYATAGATDVYARLVVRHIGKHIPGNPNVIARNMPGAGSILA